MTESTNIQNYSQALAFLYGSVDYERTPGVSYDSAHYDLEGFRSFLEHTGNLHLRAPAIHIAGTKGKGSTAVMIAAGLEFSGYRTGLFTSPHLISPRERIRISGKAVSRNMFTQAARIIAQNMQQSNLQTRGYRSTFECFTAMAFHCFARENTQWNILEVGMGGRLDCTNVVHPDLCVITPISLDHQESLGTTLPDIAYEKAGILKPGVPVVVSAQTPPVMAQIEKTAKDTGCKIIRSPNPENVTIHSMTSEGSVISFPQWNISRLRIPSPGFFQIQNALTAITVLRELAAGGAIRTHIDAFARGMSSIAWAGRCSMVTVNWKNRANLSLILDGAHNPAAAEALTQSLQRIFPEQSMDIILSVPANKDARGIVSLIATIARRIIVTRYHNPRAMPVETLGKVAGEFCNAVELCPEPEQALDICSNSRKQELILVTGSLYLVGEVYALIGKSEDAPDVF